MKKRRTFGPDRTKRSKRVKGRGAEVERLSREIGKYRAELKSRNDELDEMRVKFKELERIIDSVPAQVFYKDKNNRFLWVNKKFSELMKMPKKELIGRSMSDIYPEEQAKAYWKDDLEVIRSGKPKRNIIEPTRISKGTLWVRTDKIPYRDARGNIIGVLGFAIDITERRQAEKELQRSEKRLSDIGVLAATVAHELRNPLAVIGMAAANIKRKAGNPSLDEHLYNIEKKVQESGQIINNLLSYASLRPPHYEDVCVNEMISECVRSLRQLYPRKNISIKQELALTKQVSIEADALQMKEILSNILNNSYDAVPEQGGRIEIKTVGKGEYIEIRVKDNGKGVAEEYLEKIFDPFFTTKAKGTGLGLSVCKQIIDMHGGTIQVESKPDQGTVIHITLPKGKERSK